MFKILSIFLAMELCQNCVAATGADVMPESAESVPSTYTLKLIESDNETVQIRFSLGDQNLQEETIYTPGLSSEIVNEIGGTYLQGIGITKTPAEGLLLNFYGQRALSNLSGNLHLSFPSGSIRILGSLQNNNHITVDCLRLLTS
jgi:hypothetical protein